VERSRETDVSDAADIEALIEASSLGTPEAKALRETVPVGTARAIVMAARYLGERDAARAEVAALRAAVDLHNQRQREGSDCLSAGPIHPLGRRGPT
jgi:hypothetical protein